MRGVQRSITHSFTIVAILIIATALSAGYFVYYIDAKKAGKLGNQNINSFEDCAKHYPVMESYPEQCNTPDGKHFTRELSEEENKNLIPISEESHQDPESVEGFPGSGKEKYNNKLE